MLFLQQSPTTLDGIVPKEFDGKTFGDTTRERQLALDHLYRRARHELSLAPASRQVDLLFEAMSAYNDRRLEMVRTRTHQDRILNQQMMAGTPDDPSEREVDAEILLNLPAHPVLDAPLLISDGRLRHVLEDLGLDSQRLMITVTVDEFMQHPNCGRRTALLAIELLEAHDLHFGMSAAQLAAWLRCHPMEEQS